MSYCRYCGTEISYTRTANNRWLPYDVTGEPHFCQETKKKPTTKSTGLKVCATCGKPYFLMGKKKVDYSALSAHVCKAGDITRYKKYLEKQKKSQPSNVGRKRSR